MNAIVALAIFVFLLALSVWGLILAVTRRPPDRTYLAAVAIGEVELVLQAVVALVVIAVVIMIGMTYVPLIHQNERMRREILRLDAELQKQETISRQLRADVDALRSDPATVTRLAREKLGYAKPDETVVHFDGNPPANAPK